MDATTPLLQALGPALASGTTALAFVVVFVIGILKNDCGNARMVEIASAIQTGARAFLIREYTFVAVFVTVVTILLFVQSAATAFSFIVGACLSALCGWIGMTTAVRSNVRTTAAATIGLNAALRVAFKAGAVMGLTVVGLGIMGLSIVLLLLSALHSSNNGNSDHIGEAIRSISGFGFGASSIALFARVGGGIFTKAADVGADLVGKVEAGIPEDDPRNPATIADNVGDNVGDVAGMGADLFESYVGGIIATMSIGYVSLENPMSGIVIPFWISSFGILASIVGTYLVRTKEGATQKDLLWAIRTGIFGASAIVIVFAAITCGFNDLEVKIDGVPTSIKWQVFGCVLVGLLAGIAIGTATEYYTSFAYRPTQSIAESSITGGATVIINGLGVGMMSCVAPVLIMVISILVTYKLAETFGIAVAGVGMLSTLGVTLATDAYGPVADNAGGIAEMSELPEEVRERTDALDALGNTTAATGKGFAIGSAVLTALALMVAFKQSQEANTGVKLVVDVAHPDVMAGMLIGALLPFVFSAFTMLAVGKSAMAIIEEVRRQFHTIPGLMEGTAKAEHHQCVAIATTAAVKEMIVPGGIAVVAPPIVGWLLGAGGLAGMLTGAISSGFLLAVTMANAGGAWDNAKKYVEAGGLGEGKGKGSDCHKGAVIGDTVGDPFKDTSGPALNILIKLMSIISLVLAQNNQFENMSVLNGGSKAPWGLGLLGIAAIGFGVAMYFTRRKPMSREFEMTSAEDTRPMTSDRDDTD